MPLNLSQFLVMRRARSRWLYWDSAAGAATYALVWGSATGTYTTSLSVGAVTKYKINDLALPVGSTAYIAVKGVDSAGTAGSASNELVVRDGAQV